MPPVWRGSNLGSFPHYFLRRVELEALRQQILSRQPRRGGFFIGENRREVAKPERLFAGVGKHVDQEEQNDNAQEYATGDHDFIDLIVFLGKAASLGIEPGATSALFQLGKTDTSLHHHGLA